MSPVHPCHFRLAAAESPERQATTWVDPLGAPETLTNLHNLGSGWDSAPASPDQTAPHHLAEWVTSSAVDPELAAANLQTLAGADAIEALVGDRLAALGAHAQQYVTAQAARLLRPLEPVAAGGGWWCSGLDPLAGWAPMAWGCFKPDRPRWDLERARQRKYEHPLGTPARSFWLRVPAAVAQRISDRARLPLPAAVLADRDGSGGAFWRWWAQTPALPLVLAEGAKKAAALLSAGLPAVALPGIWNGCPKGPAGGPPALLADLAAVPLAGRPAWVLFDWSDSDKGRRDVRKAGRRLARLLKRAGAVDVRSGACPGPDKGLDDALVAGVSLEALLAALAPLTPGPTLARLRAADRIAPAGQWLGDACPIPAAADARLVALAAAMGSGKTEAIAAAVAPLLAAGTRVLLLTHRRSLGEALADRLGLPWGDDAAPGSDLRQQGLALCIDSLCPRSGLRINPADWRGCLVVIDEAAAVLAHALFATGTAIAQRRPAVLETLEALLAGASQVLAADAQMSAPVLEALEAATGEKALLIGSSHKPAAGRELVVHPSRDSWRAELVAQLKARRRLWVATTAAEPGSPNAAQNLALLALEHWPEARVLVVDATTVADPGHAASRLAADPNGVAGDFDLVIASPAVAAGLSVTLRGHFAAVLVAAGGTTDPDSIAQAAARVRDDCPRHLWAPDASPGAHLRSGSGDTKPALLLRHLDDHSRVIAAQLLSAGASLEAGTLGPWLPLWAELAALRNGQRLGYRATAVALLEREGYRVREAEALVGDAAVMAQAAAASLAAIATEAQAAADAELIAAPLLSDTNAEKLGRKRHRSPAEAAQLARHRVARAWGLGASPPTAELLEADRERRSQRGRFGWILRTLEARPLLARRDRVIAAALAPGGRGWAPDLARELLGPKVAVADALDLGDWLERRDWFTAADADLITLQTRCLSSPGPLRQLLGVSPAKRAITTLKALLALAGYRLEAQRCRVDGERAWRYRVGPEPLPLGASEARLETAWREQLEAPAAAGCPKNRPTDKGGTLGQLAAASEITGGGGILSSTDAAVSQ